MEVRSGKLTNPGTTHSTSNDPEHHDGISEVDKLAEELWKEHHEHKDRALAACLKEAKDALIQSASKYYIDKHYVLVIIIIITNIKYYYYILDFLMASCWSANYYLSSPAIFSLRTC